jgi:DNA-binding response OmpR family regulator
MELNRASLIVLVAEDEALIAMGIEDALRRAGYTVAGMFPTSSSALEWLNRHAADAAVLDFCLGDGRCVQLLCELRSRGTPIVIYSAYSQLPAEFQDLPRLTKPASLDRVVDELDKLVLEGKSPDRVPLSKGRNASPTR